VGHFLRVEVAVQTEGRDTHSSRGPSISEGPATFSSPLRPKGSLPSPSIPSLFSQQPFCRARVCLPPPKALRCLEDRRCQGDCDTRATQLLTISQLSAILQPLFQVTSGDSGFRARMGPQGASSPCLPVARSPLRGASAVTYSVPHNSIVRAPRRPSDPQTVYPPPPHDLDAPPLRYPYLPPVFPASNRSSSTPQGPHVTRWDSPSLIFPCRRVLDPMLPEKMFPLKLL